MNRSSRFLASVLLLVFFLFCACGASAQPGGATDSPGGDILSGLSEEELKTLMEQLGVEDTSSLTQAQWLELMQVITSFWGQETVEFAEDDLNALEGLGEQFALTEDGETVYQHTSGDFRYAIREDGAAVITGYIGNAADVTVPAQLDGHPVREIGDEAFYHQFLVSVTLPDCIQTIGAEAFGAMTYLSSVNLPEGIVRIGDGAFVLGSNMESLTLPDSLREIGANPFAACRAKLILSADHPVFELEDGVLFGREDRKLISYPYGRTEKTYAVPEGTLALGDHAFEFAENLRTLTLPEGLEGIGEDCFLFCTGLRSLDLPDSLRSVGAYAFNQCSGLTSVAFPEGLDSLGEGVFSSCTSLAEIVIPPGIRHLSTYTFWYCSKLTSIALPAGLESIGEKAFVSCDSLAALTLPEGITRLEDYTFMDCGKLRSLTLPVGIAFIGPDAFYNCPNLVLDVVRGSYAQAWAEENGVEYTARDGAAAQDQGVPAGGETGPYRELRVGDRGDPVLALKQRLYSLGYFKTAAFNDSFTENTANTVREFERNNALPEDGVADPEMQALLFSQGAVGK